MAGCPDAPALDDGRAAFSYRALAAEVGTLAARLRRAGIGAGDHVGVRVPSGTADLYVAILGVLAAGAAYVPVDMDDPDERAFEFARVPRDDGLADGARCNEALVAGLRVREDQHVVSSTIPKNSSCR